MTSVLSEFPEQLKIYYRRLFPFDTYYQWLAYEHEGQKRSFETREFSFTLPGDIYIRYNTFTSKEELMTNIQRDMPIKIDLGAEYNIRPTRQNSRMNDNLKPLRRELVFDIDMTDYDDVRKCCQKGNICEKCWKFMKIAVKVIDTTLREDFNFHHMLWVYSGRRGIHCWICDKAARRLTNRARRGVTEYLNITPFEGKTHRKKANIYRRHKLHDSVRRAVAIIDTYFEELCLKDQDILGTSSDMTKFLKRLHDDKFADELEKEFEKHDNSVDRWKAFLNLYDYYLQKGILKYNMINIREEMKVFYAFPRIDVNVSKGLKHLLKSPFCVHPKTGRVCVPFNPKVVDKFDPLVVPTISVLLDEISQFDASTVDPSVPSFSVTAAKDNRKTSLIKALVVFEQFVSRLQRLKGAPPEGLSLGSGLVIFASVLSEAYMERPQMISRLTGAHSAYLSSSGSKMNDALSPPYDYRYGWSFFAAGAAFIMAELAALLSITAYLRRFPTVEDMVRVMVPGAERKLREHHQHLSSDYLVRHADGSSRGSSSHHLHHHSSTQHCTSNSAPTKYPLSTTTQNYHTMRTQYDIIHHNTSSSGGAGGGTGVGVPLLHHHSNTNICTVNNRKCDNPYMHHHHHKDLLLDHVTSHNDEGHGHGTEMIGCDGPLLLLNKTTPDLCSTSNNDQQQQSPLNSDFCGNENVTDSLHVTSSVVIPGLNEQDFGPTIPPPNTTTIKTQSTPNNYLFAGQTVPIKIKKGSSQYSDQHNRYGTLPLSGSAIMHQGILGVCQVSGDSSSSTSSSYCSKSKTLHHKNKKSTIGNTTFSTMDCSSFEQFETQQLKQQRTNTIGAPSGGNSGSYNTSSSAV